jgi:uncharacterized membrane protein
LEAFSDGVIAILITILVLELKIPHGESWADLKPSLPTFMVYVLSFVYLGIYWNNHHHMLHMATKVNGAVLWANLHLLFWLSLVPFVTGWMGENHFAPLPTALYGVFLFLSGLAYKILQEMLIRAERPHSRLKEAIGDDRKAYISATLYFVAIPLAFVNRWISYAIYVFVAFVWLIPDQRIESKLHD